jgi:hypothetical protein
LGSAPIALVSLVGRKALDEVGSLESGAPSITMRRSFWSSTELVMAGTEGFGCCERAPPTGQEAACWWHDVELSACYTVARSTNVRMLRWSSCC